MSHIDIYTIKKHFYETLIHIKLSYRSRSTLPHSSKHHLILAHCQSNLQSLPCITKCFLHIAFLCPLRPVLNRILTQIEIFTNCNLEPYTSYYLYSDS